MTREKDMGGGLSNSGFAVDMSGEYAISFF